MINTKNRVKRVNKSLNSKNRVLPKKEEEEDNIMGHDKWTLIHYYVFLKRKDIVWTTLFNNGLTPLIYNDVIIYKGDFCAVNDWGELC